MCVNITFRESIDQQVLKTTNIHLTTHWDKTWKINSRCGNMNECVLSMNIAKSDIHGRVCTQ